MKLHITCRIMIPVDGRIIDGREKNSHFDGITGDESFRSARNKRHKQRKTDIV